jgi:DNA-binding CsgD family transcriptional regulator
MEQLREEKHREILDAKMREVTSYSLMLSNKNNVLQEVLEQAVPLKNVVNAKDVHLVKKITDVVNDSLRKDQESNKFMHHFNEVHPKFFEALKATSSSLTENNLRLCAYFKMGMSTKQVAAILNVSLETVKNGRYRLKKKLGLSEEDSLDDFIRKL